MLLNLSTYFCVFLYTSLSSSSRLTALRALTCKITATCALDKIWMSSNSGPNWRSAAFSTVDAPDSPRRALPSVMVDHFEDEADGNLGVESESVSQSLIRHDLKVVDMSKSPQLQMSLAPTSTPIFSSQLYNSVLLQSSASRPNIRYYHSRNSCTSPAFNNYWFRAPY